MDVLTLTLSILFISIAIAYISVIIYFYIKSLTLTKCLFKNCYQELQLPTNDPSSWFALNACICKNCKSYSPNPEICDCYLTTCKDLSGQELSTCITTNCKPPETTPAPAAIPDIIVTTSAPTP
jgi:hypothetical protein